MGKQKTFELVLLEHDFESLSTFEDILLEGVTLKEADNYVHLNADNIKPKVRHRCDYDLLLVPTGNVNKAYEQAFENLTQEEKNDWYDGMRSMPDLDPDVLDVHKSWNLERIIDEMKGAKELYT